MSLTNPSHTKGYSYTHSLLAKGEKVSVHSVMQDYKYDEVPKKYKEIWKNPQLFEQGVRDCIDDYKKGKLMGVRYP